MGLYYSSSSAISGFFNEFYNASEPCLLEIKVKSGARKDLGRPKEKLVENKQAFMEYVKG